MADLIDRDALEPFYERSTDPNDTYADMTLKKTRSAVYGGLKRKVNLKRRMKHD